MNLLTKNFFRLTLNCKSYFMLFDTSISSVDLYLFNDLSL